MGYNNKLTNSICFGMEKDIIYLICNIKAFRASTNSYILTTKAQNSILMITQSYQSYN